MKEWAWKTVVVGMLFAITGAPSMLRAQQPAPELILSNGKIITVDERFTIAQAVAIRNDRIVAVGSNQEIGQLAGRNTKRIDLKGKAVIPGLIDNHAHLLRAGIAWQQEVRLDGIESRQQAVEMLRARVNAAAPGEWIYTFGGWAHQQFTDNKKPFTREELDQIAPNNPLMLQEAYYRIYLNSRGLQALGIDEKGPNSKWIVRDATGKPTGVIEQDGVRPIASKVPPPPKDKIESSSLSMIKDFNRAGLTAFGSSGCDKELREMYRRWERQGQSSMRVFCLDAFGADTPEQVDKILPQISQLKFYQGSNYVDDAAYGEQLYGPANDNMLDIEPNQTPDDFEQWGRVATQVAKAGLPIHVHATLEATIEGFLTQIERINQEHPVKNLRWSLAHLDQPTPAQLERMKKLGMYAAVHTRPSIMGGIFHDIHGDRAYDMPPLRLIQNSGITWGLGTDTTVVNQYRPLTTLWFAVTGKMVGGTVVNRQTISREDALIAHTRKNAYFIFQENNLGSIQPGKLADLVVLDRDYLTVPADQIKDIKPVMTMVGGKIVYDTGTN